MVQYAKYLRRLLRREDGSATLLVGLGATLLIASAGVAIDMGRVQTAQSRLSSALDAAGLAAGNAISSGNANAVALKYFWANYPANYMGSTVNNPTIVPNADNSKITLDVTGTVPTTFMKIFGKTSVPIKAHAEISRANLGLELVLVMDVTGSMGNSAGGGISKLQAAKNAATDLINILYGSKTTLENVWIGMVPFAQTVKIGTARANWTSDSSVAATPGWGPTSWSGCVEARGAGGMDTNDIPPTPPNNLFPKYYSPCNADTGSNDDDTNGWFGNNSSATGGNEKWGNCSTGSGMQYRSLNTTSLGPNKGCSMPAITPLTASKSTILSAITALTANGSTEIPLGVAWGWRLISPSWRGMWGGEMDASNLPLDYDTPLMTKVVIVMTDGDNDISWDNYTAYGTPNLTTGPQLGPNACSGFGGNCNTGEGVLNTRTTQICNAMKAQGILVYTIAFGTDISGTAQTMLQNCASSTDYYFYSPTAASLSTAFKQIGDSLANLHISQ